LPIKSRIGAKMVDWHTESTAAQPDHGRDQQRRRQEAIAEAESLGLKVTPEGLDRAKAKLEAATAHHTPENRAEWLRRLGITDAAA
jgi:hypothetical protein